MNTIPVLLYNYSLCDMTYLILNQTDKLLFICDIYGHFCNPAFRYLPKYLHDEYGTIEKYITYENAFDIVKRNVNYANIKYTHKEGYFSFVQNLDVDFDDIDNAVVSFYSKYYKIISCIRNLQIKWKKIYSKKVKAAVIIQKIWKESTSNPHKLLCKKRLYKEFDEFYNQSNFITL